MAKHDRLLASDLDIREYLLGLPPRWRAKAIEALGPEDREVYDRAWDEWAHDGQLAPLGDWSTWVIKAGRGFGKTLAGAQWLTARIAEHPDTPLSIALVGATIEDACRVGDELAEAGSGAAAQLLVRARRACSEDNARERSGCSEKQ